MQITLKRLVSVGHVLEGGSPVTFWEYGPLELAAMPARGDSIQLHEGGEHYHVGCRDRDDMPVEVGVATWEAWRDKVVVWIEPSDGHDQEEFAQECEQLAAEGWRCVERHDEPS